MRRITYVLALAIAVCTITSFSNAQAFIGGGSSALFLELGQAALVSVGNAHIVGGNPTFCIYAHKSGNLNPASSVKAQDNRLGPTATTESGDFWIVWGPIASNCANPDLASPFYMYTSLDSVLGDRGYFEVDPGVAGGCGPGPGYCQLLSLAPADLVCPGTGCPDSLLNVNAPAAPFNNVANNAPPPAALISSINNAHWNWAGTTVRPEDAKFETFRLLTSCNVWIDRQPFDQLRRQVQGLGYVNGNLISDDFVRAKSVHVKDFNITGNDPLNTNFPVPGYTLSTIGAKPVIVAVGPSPSPSGTGIALATDIPGFVAANLFSGVLGRATDLLGPTAAWAVTTLIPEPLSGAYNVFEYGLVNSSKYHTSQDAISCMPGGAPSNPLHIVSANGAGLEGGSVQAFRRRVIGSGQMTSTLQSAIEGGGHNPSETYIGYFFWGAANVVGLTNVKYLTVDGVDPIQDHYANGTLPSSGGPGDPCNGVISNCPSGLISLKGLKSGDYALWSALRVVSAAPTPAGITSIISALQTPVLATLENVGDFVPSRSLNAWRSHYSLPTLGINTASNGPNIAGGNDLCNPGGAGALAEQGGDAGGAIILKQANADFCSDFGNNTGIINKTE